MDSETLQALGQLGLGLRDEIQASVAATHHLIAESGDRMRGYVDVRLTESEGRTRRHFDVVAESLRGDIRSLAERIMAVAEGSMRRDAQLGDRIDRLDQRVLGLESRVSVLEGPRPGRRRRR